MIRLTDPLISSKTKAKNRVFPFPAWILSGLPCFSVNLARSYMKIRVYCERVVPKEFGWGYRKEPLSSEAIPSFLTDQAWKIDKNWGHPTGLRTTEDHKHPLGATIWPEHWNTAAEYHYCHPTLEWVLNISLPFSYSKGKEVTGKALIMCYELDALMSGRMRTRLF